MKKLETRIKLCEKLIKEDSNYNFIRQYELDIGYGNQTYTVIWGGLFAIITKEDFPPLIFRSFPYGKTMSQILKGIPRGKPVVINDSLLRQTIKDAPKGKTKYAPVRIGGKTFDAKLIGQVFDIAGAWDGYTWYANSKRYSPSLVYFDKGIIIICPMRCNDGIDVEEKE